MEVNAPMRKIVRCRKGQSLIELTFIFPILLALVYGSVEIGNTISIYLTITHMTREGANLAARGTDPTAALNTVKTAAAPTITTSNQTRWRIVYSRLIQDPAQPCPPTPCKYIIDPTPDPLNPGRIIQGDFSQTSKLGPVGATVTIPGIDTVAPNQIFHTFEAFYDYSPYVITYVGKMINTTLYDRTIFTNVGSF